jgi:major inositol transporter-like SP family MFS transporter
VVPLYLSEIAPTRMRGVIGSLNQLMIVVGILVAFIVNAILASSGDWRLMLGLAAVPSLVLLWGCSSCRRRPASSSGRATRTRPATCWGS